MSRKILALVAEPISGDALKSAPALDSKAHFWTSDSDDAIARADQVQEETVERMAEDDVDVVGDTGESDPLLALQDALATFPAEETVALVVRVRDDHDRGASRCRCDGWRWTLS